MILHYFLNSRCLSNNCRGEGIRKNILSREMSGEEGRLLLLLCPPPKSKSGWNTESAVGVSGRSGAPADRQGQVSASWAGRAKDLVCSERDEGHSRIWHRSAPHDLESSLYLS